MIAFDPEAYYDTARRLATDRSAWLLVKERLTSQRSTAPLFDSIRFTGDMKAPYLTLFAGTPHRPASLSAACVEATRGLEPFPDDPRSKTSPA